MPNAKWKMQNTILLPPKLKLLFGEIPIESKQERDNKLIYLDQQSSNHMFVVFIFSLIFFGYKDGPEIAYREEREWGKRERILNSKESYI